MMFKEFFPWTWQQQIPVLGMQQQFVFPKIILLLTERECEELAASFDVNQAYDIELSNHSMKFNKVS